MSKNSVFAPAATAGLILVAAAVLGIAMGGPRPASADDAELLAALRSGDHVGLMRHAIAPGSDDPPDFRIGDCSTQRNLSAEGRDQAARVGARLRAAGITSATIVSSQWCRCLDTARALDLGDVEELPALNSLILNFGRRDEMTRDFRNWILQQDLSRPTIMVSHQVNISALIGMYPEEGEIVVVQRTPQGELRAIGTIGAP